MMMEASECLPSSPWQRRREKQRGHDPRASCLVWIVCRDGGQRLVFVRDVGALHWHGRQAIPAFAEAFHPSEDLLLVMAPDGSHSHSQKTSTAHPTHFPQLACRSSISFLTLRSR
jgi:hypothetical protein